MPDIKPWIEQVERLDPPDQWAEIERRLATSGDQISARSPVRALALLALTLVITVGLAAFLKASFRTPDSTSTPASPPGQVVGPSVEPVVHDVSLGSTTNLAITQHGGLGSMVDAFGSAWVIGQFTSGSGEETLRRIDPDTGAVRARFTIPITGGGEWGGDGLVVGGGFVWGTAWNSATIFRIDPTDDSVVSFQLDGRVVSEVAYDAHGQLWAVVAPRKGIQASSLVSIDPSDGNVLSSRQFQLEWASGLLPADDTVWILGRHVANQGVSDGFLHQLSPGTVADLTTGGSFALPVTDGNWIWTPASGDKLAMNLASGIVQVDPSTGAVIDEWNAGNVGYDIAVGPDGGVWFLGPKGLERLNPSSGRVESWSLRADETPIFIVPSANGIWVGTYEGSLDFRPFK